MTMTRHLIAAVAVALTLVAAGRAEAQMKIAVVDMQRAINETEEGRKAKAKLKQLFEQRQKTLNNKQQELKSLKQDIEKQRNVLSQQALQKKLESYQKAVMELQTVYSEYQRELSGKEAELTQHIVEKMREILRRIGQSQGYTLIIESNEAGVVWVPSNLDLTDLLIQKYNARKKGSK